MCVVGQEKVQDKTVSLCFEKYEDKRIQILKNLKQYKNVLLKGEHDKAKIKFSYVGKRTRQGNPLKERIVYIFTQRQPCQNTYQALVWLWPLMEQKRQQGRTFFFVVEPSKIWTPEIVLSLLLYIVFSLSTRFG